MALMTWSGSRVRKQDVIIAKNYLTLLLAPLSGLLAADKPKFNILHIHAAGDDELGLRGIEGNLGPPCTLPIVKRRSRRF